MAGNTFRVGFVGMGMRGVHYHRLTGSIPEFEIAAAAESEGVQRDRVRELFPGLRLYQDYGEMLDREEIDLVVLSTPDDCHEEQAVDIFRRGKHLVLEKPMALTPEGCFRILDAWRPTGKLLAVCYVLRYHELYRTTKRLVNEGAIGRIKAVWVHHSVILYYFHKWMGEREHTGGLLLQKGSHDLDIINWVVESEPVKVSAFAGLDHFGGSEPDDLICPKCTKAATCVEYVDAANAPPGYAEGARTRAKRYLKCAFRKGISVHDNHVVNLLYANGVKASYTECHFTPIDQRLFKFIGDEGMVECDSVTNAVTLRRRKSNETRVYHIRAGAGGHGGGDLGLLEDVRDSLIRAKAPLADGRAGALGIIAAEGAERSIASGATVDLTGYLSTLDRIVPRAYGE